MREILFRGKDSNGMWHEGYYCVINDKVHRIYTRYTETNCGTDYPDFYTVIPETVGQYTGLKDKNGTKIFEGDIVEIEDFTNGLALNYKQPRARFIVKWNDDLAKFYIDYMKLMPFEFDKKSEVIGNIHDNFEMIKGE